MAINYDDVKARQQLVFASQADKQPKPTQEQMDRARQNTRYTEPGRYQGSPHDFFRAMRKRAEQNGNHQALGYIDHLMGQLPDENGNGIPDNREGRGVPRGGPYRPLPPSVPGTEPNVIARWGPNQQGRQLPGPRDVNPDFAGPLPGPQAPQPTFIGAYNQAKQAVLAGDRPGAERAYAMMHDLLLSLGPNAVQQPVPPGFTDGMAELRKAIDALPAPVSAPYGPRGMPWQGPNIQPPGSLPTLPMGPKLNTNPAPNNPGLYTGARYNFPGGGYMAMTPDNKWQMTMMPNGQATFEPAVHLAALDQGPPITRDSPYGPVTKVPGFGTFIGAVPPELAKGVPIGPNGQTTLTPEQVRAFDVQRQQQLQAARLQEVRGLGYNSVDDYMNAQRAMAPPPDGRLGLMQQQTAAPPSTPYGPAANAPVTSSATSTAPPPAPAHVPLSQRAAPMPGAAPAVGSADWYAKEAANRQRLDAMRSQVQSQMYGPPATFTAPSV